MKKVNELLTYGTMLQSLIVAYVQYVTMLVELQKAKPGLKVFVWEVYHSPIGMNHTKNYGCEFLTFLMHYK
jgi:hypothetical protein